MSLINKELKKKSSASLKIQPSKQNLGKQSKNQVLKSKSQSGVCKSCQKRVELVKKLKDLCKELDTINKPKDDDDGLQINMYNKDLTWLEENIPLITYPLKSKPSCIWNNPCQDFPPWKLPRFPSQELIASRMLKNCECRKRNGLQDGCNRSLCKGSVHCLRKPDPVCIPSGMWKKMFTPEEYQKLMDYIDGVKRKRVKPVEFCTCEPDQPKKEESTTSICDTCSCRSYATSHHDSCSACVGSTNRSICSTCVHGEDCSSCSSQEEEVGSKKLSSAVVDSCRIPSKKKVKNESLSGTEDHSCSECEDKPKIIVDSNKDENKDGPIYYTDKDNNKKILTSILKVKK